MTVAWNCPGLARRVDFMNRALIGFADKTSPLIHFALDDLPRGLTLIDPTGDFARVLANRIPPSLMKRAVYFEPSNENNIFGLNFIETIPKDKHDQFVEQFCAGFNALFPEGANTMAQLNATFILATCLDTLLSNPDVTLLSVLKLLKDEDYRTRLNTDDPLASWDMLADRKRDFQSGFAFLETKLRLLLRSRIIRNIVGSAMLLTSEQDIVIADLSKIGNRAARLLATLLIARSQGALYILDLGFFGTDALADIFKEDRLTVTLRFLDELPTKLRQEVMGIDEKYIFRTTPKDAEELASRMGRTNPSSLTDVADHQILTVAGLERKPPIPASLKRLRALKSHTRAYYTQPRSKVERTIRGQL
jgi:hypothetical protein